MDREQPGELSLSTVWISAAPGFIEQPPSAEEVLDLAQAAGFNRLELEYRLPTALMARLVPAAAKRGFSISSLHNYCPFPQGLKGRRPSGDLFNLAALESEERRRAVDYTVNTLETAHEAEASAVVLHLGWVNGLEDRGLIKRAAEQGGISPELAAQLQQRAAMSPPHLDAVSFALERLLKRAEPLGVRLGLENRFHAFQLPDQEEMALLLERFAGAPLGYWHDMGHALVQEAAGLDTAQSWLAQFQGQLLGCHLHDVQGALDHLPPGEGEVDWPETVQDLAHAPIKVLECRPGPEAQRMAEAGKWLSELLAAAQSGGEREVSA